ncbi:hypothetical protein SRHO_G00040710 [Serrasalmus rhombeus]
MSGKVVLYYFDGRGKMESIRWLLAVAGVEFEEVFLTTRANYEELVNDGALLFHQVPMVEMDGMKLVQSKAIMNYIAGKYNLYGKDLKERVMIDMYAEAARDIMDMIMMLPFIPPETVKSWKKFRSKPKSALFQLLKRLSVLLSSSWVTS